MIEIIVTLAASFALLFSIAWAVRPDLRQRLEKPKYRFQKDLQNNEEK